MLDLTYVRANLATVEAKLRSRSAETAAPLANFAAIDSTRREAVTRLETLQAERNKLTAEIQQLRKSGADATAPTERTRELKRESESLTEAAASADTQLRTLLEALPNLPQDSVPAGTSEHDNAVTHTWGEIPHFDFPAKPHWELGESLGILDFERAAKISGSRFTIHFNQGAQLERALANFMLDLHTREHGYTEVQPPTMVNSKSLFGTGQLPKFAEDLFHCDDRGPYEGIPQPNDHWLIPTAEVPVTNIFRDEILDDADLPISFCAYTSCFRSEAGSYGKDVRGLIRQHQFQKVELVKFVRPQDSGREHEALTRHAETVLERLGLPYRRMLLCTGDMGFSVRQNLRPRSLAPRPGPLPRNLLLLQLRGLPSPPRQHQVPRRRSEKARVSPHPQRLRPRGRPHLSRHSGKLPAGRRHRSHPRCARTVHERRDRHRPPVRRVAPQRQKVMGKLLKSYFFWTYERGSLHYDIIVTLILIFMFVTPQFVNFGDRLVETVALHKSEVLVKEAGTRGDRARFVYQVRADDMPTIHTDAERDAAILRLIEPISGEVTLERSEAVKDAAGRIIAYNATVLK